MQGKNGMCIRCNAVTDFQGRPERAALKDVRTGALKDANGEEQECATGRRKKRSEKCVTPVCQALRKFVRGNLLKTSCGSFLSSLVTFDPGERQSSGHSEMGQKAMEFDDLLRC